MRFEDIPSGFPRQLRADFYPEPELIPDARIAKAVSEVRELAERYQKARHDLHEAGLEIERTRLGDTEASAEAIRAGKPAPKPKLEAAKARREKLTAEVAALLKATETAANDVLSAFEEHGPGLREKLHEQAQAERHAIIDALEQADRHRAVLEATRHLLFYIEADELVLWRPQKFGRLARLTETDKSFSEVIEALCRVVAELDKPKRMQVAA